MKAKQRKRTKFFYFINKDAAEKLIALGFKCREELDLDDKLVYIFTENDNLVRTLRDNRLTFNAKRDYYVTDRLNLHKIRKEQV